MCIFKAVGLSMGRETLLPEKRGEGEIEKRKQARPPPGQHSIYNQKDTLTDGKVPPMSGMFHLNVGPFT